MKNFLQGLLLGVLVTLPVYLLSEQIRYGFVSNHVALWVLVGVLCAVGLTQHKGVYFSLMTRMGMFVLYSVAITALLMRTISESGLLLAVLLFASIYACYEVFNIARKS
jgi:hypothetical protein